MFAPFAFTEQGVAVYALGGENFGCGLPHPVFCVRACAERLCHPKTASAMMSSNLLQVPPVWLN